jgi:hypothetical protein
MQFVKSKVSLKWVSITKKVKKKLRLISDDQEELVHVTLHAYLCMPISSHNFILNCFVFLCSFHLKSLDLFK